MKHSKAFDINNRAQIIFQNLIVIDNEEYTRYIREYNTKNIQDDSTDIYVILATYVDTPGTYARLKK
jgi:oligoribonuclease NrnB/cAMP/cGMP phosphodiesterase (DHH superfamily)